MPSFHRENEFQRRFLRVELRLLVRLAVERRDPPELRRAVFRPARLVVARFVVARFAVDRLAVVLRRPVERFAVAFRADARFTVERRRVVLRPPSDIPALIGDGGGGVGLPGIGAGQTEPGSFCADQSVPWSSSMVPPQKCDGFGCE
ncbi:MAG: hypothetical protein E6H84_06330 [Chloroflexi bacterium]|nr:MAG: hypothetical protein E6H84_06330 [Chloroflexota bacterium]TMG71126.1 MAG: hypothetical protein E6H81_05260 [Chloroflexota bacterium]